MPSQAATETTASARSRVIGAAPSVRRRSRRGGSPTLPGESRLTGPGPGGRVRGVRARARPKPSRSDHGRGVAIDAVIRGLRRTAPTWNPTALAVIATREGDPFRVLIACILSLRTQDTTTGPASDRLFAEAATPESMLKLTPRRIERLIYPVGFYRTKARVILGICHDLLDRFAGRVPDTIDDLLTLNGVGRKTANLVVTMGYGKPGICVDTHVHRISNRLGYVKTRHPEETEMALRAKLPRRHWIGYNDLLVSFGQNVCTPLSPRCSICPVSSLCRKVGVTKAR
ncbi:MAG: endonuclease III [Candidatus Rokuibacteriota bacterium]|nr:MAG: endonuclease III [Candidatus Rokubacteria bacterium]